jgi:hypothetical protein
MVALPQKRRIEMGLYILMIVAALFTVLCLLVAFGSFLMKKDEEEEGGADKWIKSTVEGFFDRWFCKTQRDKDGMNWARNLREFQETGKMGTRPDNDFFTRDSSS